MRQFSHWVSELAIDLNEIFTYITHIKRVQSTQDIITIRRALTWATSFYIMILHNLIPESAPILNYRTNYRNRHYFENKIDNLQLTVRRCTEVTPRVNQLVNKTVTKLLHLLDFAVHNCHTFESRIHMHQTLYFLQNIMASVYTATRHDFMPFSAKTTVHKQMAILHFRVAQIFGILNPGSLDVIQPPFISCPP